MTPAQLKTIREYLGLPVSWLAKQANVLERTVRYWESGRTKIPEDVSSSIAEILCIIEKESEELYNHLLVAYEKEDEIIIERFKEDKDLWSFDSIMKDLKMPASSQSLIIMKVVQRLESEGKKYKIIYHGED